MVRHDEEICTCLRCRVWGRCLDLIVLGEEEIRAVQWQVAVYLIGRNLMITLDAVLLAGVEQGYGTADVRLKEDVRVRHRTIYVRLRSEVDDDIRLLLLEELEDERTVGDVALDELVVRLALERCEGLEVTCIGQGIEADPHILRIGVDCKVHKVAADKAGATGYDIFHSEFLSWIIGCPGVSHRIRPL